MGTKIEKRPVRFLNGATGLDAAIADLPASVQAAATIVAALPTTDPEVSGQIWNDNGVLKASAGA